MKKLLLLAIFSLSSTLLLKAQEPRWGYALQFNGTDQDVITPDLYNEFNGTSRTIELWFNAESEGIILNEQGSTTLDSNWFDSQIEIVGTTLKVAVWGGIGEHYSIDIGTISYNTWNHVVLRYDHSTNLLEGFLNGVKSANSISVTITQPDTGELYYRVASYTLTNLGSEAWFTGLIDEVRFWNDVRTDQEIYDNIANVLTGDETNLVAYYTMDEGAGVSTADNSTTTYTATLVNNPSWISSTVPADYSGGLGTANAPYKIATADDLTHLSQTQTDWSYDFIQTADIVFDPDHTQVNWNGSGGGTGWLLIGMNDVNWLGTSAFIGTYDGQYHTVSNIYCYSNTVEASMFGRVGKSGDPGVVKNLGLINITVYGSGLAAGLVSYLANGSLVQNCFVSGNIYNNGSLWSESGAGTGGLIGYASGSTVRNSYSTASIENSENFSGKNAGLIGRTSGGSVNYCYASGTVSAVSSTSKGGLVGESSSTTFTDCFWDTETTGLSTSAGGTGKTTAQMKDSTTFINWDFTSTPVWNIQSGYYYSYPFLEGFNYDAVDAETEINPIPGLLAVTELIRLGSTSSQWHNTLNWSRGVIPTSTIDVVIPASGITNYPVIYTTSNAAVKNLTINAAGNDILQIQQGATLNINGTYNAAQGAKIKVGTTPEG